MLNSKFQERALILIGHIGMLGILALAWCMWLERSTIFDSSLYSYMMIWREGFYIPHDRRINYLWQWIPILSLKLGVSLPTFLKLVSVSPILFLYGVFAFIVHFLKHKMGGLYLVLSLVVLTRYKFYSAISEIYLSVAFVALMFAWLTMDRSNLLWLGKRTYPILGIGIIALCYLGHPLVFYPMGVLLIFDYSLQEKWVSKNHLVWLAATCTLFILKYVVAKGSSYEGKVVEDFQGNTFSFDFLTSTLDLYTVQIFWRYVETQWAFPFLVCVVMLIYLLLQKKIIASIIVLSSSIVWIIFVAQLNAYLIRPHLFMIEGYYGLLVLIILLPFVYAKFENANFVHLRNVVALALIIFGLHRISSVRSFYTHRMNDVKQKISLKKENDSRNLVFGTNQATWDTYWFFWSVPFESLILSSLDKEQESSVILLDNNPSNEILEEPFEIMLGTDKDSIKNLNLDFFNVDQSPFVQIN